MYRNFKLFSLFALLALLLSTASGVVVAQEPLTPEQIASNYREVQTNAQLTDEEKIKNAIETYFTLRYESQKLLEPQDFSFLTANSSQARSWVEREQDKREIELFIASIYNLNYVKYEYSLDYDSIEVRDEGATVRLRESHSVVFEAIAPEISKLAGLEHVIVLRKTSAGWVIVRDEYQDELTQLMANEAKDAIIERVHLNRESELQQAAEFESTNKKEQGATINSGSWHAYDRSAARTYADTWGDWQDNPYYHRNPAYQNFDGNGGDCTNYASQVIYAGAPQLDYGGSYVWCPYSDSWIYVNGLHDYLTNNTWTGPYGSNSNMCDMDRGDIIQLQSGTSWFHSLVVVHSYYPNRCWDPSYIWYNCHSVDR
ncbi:MAG: amidase domain-containing protein [Anaerolineae bacterium]